MKRGCLDNLLFGVLLLLAFGGSTYFWFTFFVKGRSLPTPNLIGRSINDARAIAQDLGVELIVDTTHRRNSDKVPVGNVVWQNREPGATSFIKRGSQIRVELSAGPLVLRVPDLTAQTPGTAMLRLGQQNLKLGDVAYIDGDAKGIVSADPPSGTVVAPQTGVSLLVAVPQVPRAYVMPDLIDHRLDAVRPALEARGLNVATVKYEAYPGIADGIIIRQYPLRGAPVSNRDPISLVVSRQEETRIIGAEAEQQVTPVPPPAPVTQ
ncbi:MAG: PASTA domain-containing protein [Thermoanaerobaculia bacterium]